MTGGDALVQTLLSHGVTNSINLETGERGPAGRGKLLLRD
jgi:hypothetical protein